MADRQQTLQALKDTGVVAVIRADKAEDLVDVGRALRQGGVQFIEITMTVPGAIGGIERGTAALQHDDVYIGAGTVLDSETARQTILAGANYVVSPVFRPGVGGPQFFKDLKGPFPHIEIMPTGAVNREIAPAFIKAGACAVAVGGELAGKPLIAARDFATITKNAAGFLAIVEAAKKK